MEIEAKYTILDEQALARLLGVPVLAGYTLGAGMRSILHDRYLDTAAGAFSAAGFALRLRQDGDRVLATLKGLGHAEGAVHRRVEYEVELPAPLLPDRWPAGPARDIALRLCQDRPLEVLFGIDQERVTRRICDGDRPVADLSGDRVEVRSRSAAGEGKDASEGGAGLFADRAGDPICGRFLELEIELLPGGTEEDLARISGELVTLWPLRPVSDSKFHRAQAMLDAGRALPPVVLPEASHPSASPRAPKIRAGDPMSEAGRRVMGFHFHRMLLNEPGTRAGADIEALHDMRVATRRLRAAFRIFGDFYEPGSIAPFLKALRQTGRALGEVRDLDVFEQKTRTYLETLPEAQRGGMDAFLQEIQAHRDAARERLLAHLDSARYESFVAAFADFVDASSPLPAPGDQPPAPHLVRHVAPVAIMERWAAVRAFEGWVEAPGQPLARYHVLRIVAKRLRYALEFFSQVLGPECQTLVKQTVALQDHLGLLQDAVVASAILRDFLVWGTWGAALEGKKRRRSAPPEVAPGVAFYLAVRQSEIQELLAGFPPVWATITEPSFARSLAAAVGML